MNKSLSYVVVIAVVLSLAINVYSLFGKGTVLGAEGDTGFTNVVATGDITSGDDITVGDDLIVGGSATLEGINLGGLYSTSSLAASTTLLAATVCDYGIVSVVPGNVASQIGVALPSTTTLIAACLPNVGDSRTFLFENAATAATSTVITAPAGITLVSDDANGDIIAQNGWAEITITYLRATGDELSAVIRPYIDAD